MRPDASATRPWDRTAPLRPADSQRPVGPGVVFTGLVAVARVLAGLGSLDDRR